MNKRKQTIKWQWNTVKSSLEELSNHRGEQTNKDWSANAFQADDDVSSHEFLFEPCWSLSKLGYWPISTNGSVRVARVGYLNIVLTIKDDK